MQSNKDDIQECWEDLVKTAEQSTLAEIKANAAKTHASAYGTY